MARADGRRPRSDRRCRNISGPRRRLSWFHAERSAERLRGLRPEVGLMPPFSRLREALVPDTDVRSALLCTYGLDAQFFEAEILPDLLPRALATDATAGSLSAYLYEADGATATSHIEVLYDHLTGDGPQLFLGYRQINLGGRAF